MRGGGAFIGWVCRWDVRVWAGGGRMEAPGGGLGFPGRGLTNGWSMAGFGDLKGGQGASQGIKGLWKGASLCVQRDGVIGARFPRRDGGCRGGWTRVEAGDGGWHRPEPQATRTDSATFPYGWPGPPGVPHTPPAALPPSPPWPPRAATPDNGSLSAHPRKRAPPNAVPAAPRLPGRRPLSAPPPTAPGAVPIRPEAVGNSDRWTGWS